MNSAPQSKMENVWEVFVTYSGMHVIESTLSMNQIGDC